MSIPHLDHRVENGVELKYCGICNMWLSLMSFSSNKKNWDKKGTMCKECSKKYRLLRQEKLSSYQKTYYSKHKESLLKMSKEHREKNKQYYKDYLKKYQEKNKDSIQEYRKTHLYLERKSYRVYRKKITNRLNQNVSSLVRKSLRGQKGRFHWEFLVGYTLTILIKHLESLWESWMTWENYGWGPGKWVIDHIKPIVAFNFKSYDDPTGQCCVPPEAGGTCGAAH